MLAFLAEERSTHEPCGQPISESTDPRNQRRYDVEAIRCFACESRAIAAEQHNDNMAGLHFIVSLPD